jgi:hypothetical protein
MTPNRQSPALPLFARHRYPAAQQIRHRRHQRQSIFANGVDQETEPDAAIPPKPGSPARGLLRDGVGKNGRT